MFFGAIGIATLLIVSHTLADKSDTSDSNSNDLVKEVFIGSRGKRDTTSVLANDEFSKRAPMGFQGMRGKKDIMGMDVKNNLVQDEFEKRAPMGFQGMRGKKNDLVTPDLNEAFYNDEYEKRAPMGFQGMRGKKTMADDEYYKRAMMGFQGMRGKKSLEEIIEEIEKRNDIELSEMMPHKFYMDEYPVDIADKRAMQKGFHGMRGKKNDYDAVKEWEKHEPMASYYDMRDRQDILEELENLEKRAVMGFQGMRGKKDDVDNYFNDYSVDPFEYEKRAPMGFQGMRGKKDGDKRASMGFVGMRGKRNERSVALQDSRFHDNSMQFDKRALFGVSGIRGKKIPRWEIRGKFIGVRGKKWSPVNLIDGDNPMNNNRFDNIERIDMKSGTTTNFGTL